MNTGDGERLMPGTKPAQHELSPQRAQTFYLQAKWFIGRHQLGAEVAIARREIGVVKLTGQRVV